jgi:hypothetical protein
MSDPIDFIAEKNKREAPDPEFVRRDEFGRPLYCFLIDYEMDGGSWGSELWAYDAADAEKRVEAMRASLTLAGQIYTSLGV